MKPSKKVLLSAIAMAMISSVFFSTTAFAASASGGDLACAVSDTADSGASGQWEQNSGYVPMPLDTTGLLYSGQVGETLESDAFSPKFSFVGASTYESKWGTKDPSSVRNQSGWNICWALAGLGSAESSLKAMGKSVQFSPRHLAYFAYNNSNNPSAKEDGTEGDTLVSNSSGVDAPFQNGGNVYLVMAALARGVGAELESHVPYPALTAFQSPSVLRTYDTVDSPYHFHSHYQLKEGNFLPNRDSSGNLDSSAVKAALKKGLSIQVAYYSGNASQDYRYFNTSGTLRTGSEAIGYVTYYSGLSNSDTVDHAVQVVGWDDTIPKENFTSRSGTHPAHDGGWLIKNSWGSSTLDRGYFYISYDDLSLRDFITLEMDNTADNTPRYQYRYQYDGNGMNTSIGFGSSASAAVKMANLFTATDSQDLEAISFYTTDHNAKYSIQIYTDLQDATNPQSGTPAFSTEQSGTEAYAGYHTVSLKSPVRLSAGKKFSVVVTVQNPNGNAYPVACEANLNLSRGSTGSFGISSHVDAGESFVQSGGVWKDIKNVNVGGYSFGNICIKALANPSSLRLDTSAVSMISNVSNYEFLVRGNNDTANLKVESTNASVATVSLADKNDERGAKYQITAKQTGTAEIKVTYQGETKTVKVTVYPKGGSIMIDTASYTMKPGDSYGIGVDIRDKNNRKLTAAEVKALVTSGQLKVSDSRTGSIVTLSQASDGNFLVKGRNVGTAYIVYEINGTHASVRIDVKNGVKAGGSAVRNTSYWADKS